MRLNILLVCVNAIKLAELDYNKWTSYSMHVTLRRGREERQPCKLYSKCSSMNVILLISNEANFVCVGKL